MATTVKDILKVIEKIFPSEYAEKWDNCGLQVGEEGQIVNKVLLALTPTIEVIEEAVRWRADLLICHHPMSISGEKQVNNSTVYGQKIIKAIQNNLAIYSAHTNLDVANKGINDYLSCLFGLESTEALVKINDNIGLGRVGFIKEAITLKDFSHKVKEVLKLNHIRFVGNENQLINKVALCSGSGMDFVVNAYNAKADVYITGDVKYHGAIDALELGIALIDGTHFGTENIVSEIFEKILLEKFQTLEIIKDNFSADPIQIIK